MPSGRARVAVLLAIAVALAAACNTGHQRADDEFRAEAAKPAALKASGTNTPARILFDHAHDNFHRIDGRYAPFAELATSAGFDIKPTQQRFTAPTLAGVDVLVIANATPEPGLDAAQTFTDAEIDAIDAFVQRGGGLLLITDIPPWSVPAARLAERFGVRVSSGVVADPTNENPELPGWSNLVFSRANGLLGAHPITEGQSSADRVNLVATFTGQALFPPPDATVLLRIAPEARHIPYDTTYAMSRYGVEVVHTKRKAERLKNAAQAVALERGAGRVVIMGEAAAMTAQIVDEDKRFGMNLRGTDNAKFAVNTLRWLAKR